MNSNRHRDGLCCEFCGAVTRRAGGWRLAAGGWRLAAGGWRLAAGGASGLYAPVNAVERRNAEEKCSEIAN
jgi:hypothetical protein